MTLGFDPARFQTEPPACYRASWQLPGRDSHPLATTSLCWITIYTYRPPTLGAPARGSYDHMVITVFRFGVRLCSVREDLGALSLLTAGL